MSTSSRPKSYPTHSDSQIDSFLSARMDSTRHHSSTDRLRRPNTHSSLSSLDPVPEHTSSPNWKGKDRSESETNLSARSRKADWILDVLECQQGAERWSERERVVLIVGSPTVASLASMLYDPSFSDTLLLIGSNQPLPEIQALLSPSHLLSTAPDRTIYPIVQPFLCPATHEHPVPALFSQAGILAQQFRSATANPRAWSRRRDSTDSSTSKTSKTPPLTPSVQSKSGFGSGDGRDSSESLETTSRPYSSYSTLDPLPRTNSDSSISKLREGPRPPNRSRMSSFSRNSMFGGVDKSSNTSNARPATGGSPFDAVINVMPPFSDYQPETALKEMVHQAVVFTTAILPILKRSSKPSSKGEDEAEDMSISLIHLLPAQIPGPLPSVVESFLLSFMPSFARQGGREVWASVITGPVFRATQIENLLEPGPITGPQMLLFGGVRCPNNALVNSFDSRGYRPRAFIPNWGSCTPMPGILSESHQPNPTPSTSTPRAYRQPSTMLLDTSQFIPAQMAPQPPPPLQPGMNTGKLSQLSMVAFPLPQDDGELPTPELDPSLSSSSSASGSPESASDASRVEVQVQGQVGEVKKGFKGWFLYDPTFA